jgi:dihydroorotate dehydrogenase (NAD+) catalytic subunit
MTRRQTAGVKASLAVDLNGWTIPTPVMIAAGCAGTGRELAGLVETRRIGAVVSRSVTLRPRKGDPTPRIAESPSGVIWSTGLQNPGIDAFAAEELPRLAKTGAPVVVSIAGTMLEEFVRLTSLLQGRPDVSAIEVRLSEPDDELRRDVLGAHPDRAGEIVGAVARMSLVPVLAKLPAIPDGLGDLAWAVVRAGAHGLTLVDSPPALGVDAGRLRPALGPVTGWLSGPAMKPLTLRAVFEVAQALPGVPIVAVGGVRSGADAIDLLLAGAWAVQVGTATLVDPAAPVHVAQGVLDYLERERIAAPADVRARLRIPARSANGEEARA